MDIRPLLLMLSVCGPTLSTTVDTDYGGVPLWINRFLGEPSVLSLRDRMEPGWFRAVSSQSCPLKCDCPIHWPTALYCEYRGLHHPPEDLPSRTQYLFLQGNAIRHFDKEAFANVSSLRWLFLDRNQIVSEKLDHTLLSNLTRLVNLFMNHNNLTEVPAGLPSGLKQLRLAYNHIERISPGAFENLPNLTLLLLQGNWLRTLGESDFKGVSFSSYLCMHNSDSSQQCKNISNSYSTPKSTWASTVSSNSGRTWKEWISEHKCHSHKDVVSACHVRHQGFRYLTCWISVVISWTVSQSVSLHLFSSSTSPATP